MPDDQRMPSVGTQGEPDQTVRYAVCTVHPNRRNSKPAIADSDSMVALPIIHFSDSLVLLAVAQRHGAGPVAEAVLDAVLRLSLAAPALRNGLTEWHQITNRDAEMRRHPRQLHPVRVPPHAGALAAGQAPSTRRAICETGNLTGLCCRQNE